MSFWLLAGLGYPSDLTIPTEGGTRRGQGPLPMNVPESSCSRKRKGHIRKNEKK